MINHFLCNKKLIFCIITSNKTILHTKKFSIMGYMNLRKNFVILIGGPGAGKSSVINV
jgi:ABC-type uncharacterized transport system ATPase component